MTKTVSDKKSARGPGRPRLGSRSLAQITISIPREQWEWLRARAAREGHPLSQVARDILDPVIDAAMRA